MNLALGTPLAIPGASAQPYGVLWSRLWKIITHGGLDGNATDPSRRTVPRSRARDPLLIRARPFLQVILGLPPRLPGFMGFGLVMRTTGAMRTASVYDSRTPASSPRGGSKCGTSYRTFRHRVGVVLLLGWRRWRRWLRWGRLLRWWWCLR